MSEQGDPALQGGPTAHRCLALMEATALPSRHCWMRVPSVPSSRHADWLSNRAISAAVHCGRQARGSRGQHGRSMARWGLSGRMPGSPLRRTSWSQQQFSSQAPAVISQTQSHSNLVQLERLRGGRCRVSQRAESGRWEPPRPDARTLGPPHTCSREGGQRTRARNRRELCPKASSHRRRRPARAWPAPTRERGAAGRQRGILPPWWRGNEAMQTSAAGAAPGGLCVGRVVGRPPDENSK